MCHAAGGARRDATGHVRTEKVRGKWWLVDPDGYLFWSHGITGVHTRAVTNVGDREHYFEAIPAVYGNKRTIDFAKANLATVGPFLSREHAEQRGFARAVRPDNTDDGARRHLETQVLDQQSVPEALAQVVDLDHQVPQARARGDVDFFRLLALLVSLRRQFLEPLQACLALRLPRLGVRAHPFQFGLDGLLSRCLLFLFSRQALFLLIQPRRVVAFPRNAMAAVEFQDPASHVVEEVAIMGHGNHGARVAFQEAFEPGH